MTAQNLRLPSPLPRHNCSGTISTVLIHRCSFETSAFVFNWEVGREEELVQSVKVDKLSIVGNSFVTTLERRKGYQCVTKTWKYNLMPSCTQKSKYVLTVRNKGFYNFYGIF